VRVAKSDRLSFTSVQSFDGAPGFRSRLASVLVAEELSCGFEAMGAPSHVNVASLVNGAALVASNA
jgi:hypothetical protein